MFIPTVCEFFSHRNPFSHRIGLITRWDNICESAFSSLLLHVY